MRKEQVKTKTRELLIELDEIYSLERLVSEIIKITVEFKKQKVAEKEFFQIEELFKKMEMTFEEILKEALNISNNHLLSRLIEINDSEEFLEVQTIQTWINCKFNWLSKEEFEKFKSYTELQNEKEIYLQIYNKFLVDLCKVFIEFERIMYEDLKELDNSKEVNTKELIDKLSILANEISISGNMEEARLKYATAIAQIKDIIHNYKIYYARIFEENNRKDKCEDLKIILQKNIFRYTIIEKNLEIIENTVFIDDYDYIFSEDSPILEVWKIFESLLMILSA